MSHSLSSVSLKDVPAIVGAEPFRVTKPVKGLLGLMIAVAAIVFIIGIKTPMAKQMWMAYHVNLVFWTVLAAAASGFSAVFHICNAQWARPIRRLFESNINFLCLSIPALGIFYLGHHHIFSWAFELVPGRGQWQNATFVFLRDILALSILVFLIYRVIALSLRRDLVAIRSGLAKAEKGAAERWSAKHYDHYVVNANLSNPTQELSEIHEQMSRLSPAVVIAYALAISLLAFDLVMSVDPHWFSTLFGAFIFMSGAYMACAYTGMTVAFTREAHGLIRSKVERRTLHDLGKLVFGFGIFWAYLFWSHYLTIWYGNMPEETSWVILRLRQQPWHSLAWVVFGASWIIPFMLGISRDVKQMPTLLFATGVIVACGIWLQMYLLIVPTLSPHYIPLGLNDIVITLGFAGVYILSQIAFLERYPLIPFGDLYIYSATPQHGEEKKAA